MAGPFPKRSIPWLFTKAPLGGLKPLPVQRFWWVGSTILITACNEFYFADSLLLGTPSGVRDFETVTFQVCTEPSRLFTIFQFSTVIRQRRIGGG